MGKKIKIACVIGTRPEVIKMAPIYLELKNNSFFETQLICTAQHRQLLDQTMEIFDMHADIDLNIMRENQTICSLSSELFAKLDQVIKDGDFDLVIGQGDTTSVLIAAQISFYHKIPFGHVESGLRSHDLYHPFPEEMNRIFIARISSLNFAPSIDEIKTLIGEGINQDQIFETGNPVIDALYMLVKRNTPLPFDLPANKKIILVTLHRRENFGKSIQNIFESIIELSKRFEELLFIYPVHPNPNVNKPAYEWLGNNKSVRLLEAMRYDQFVTLMKNTYLIMTDSGGIQEEAPALSKPVLILRKKTERPLIVKEGVAKLLGTDKNIIIETVSDLITNQESYRAMAKGISPYGDGHSAQKIIKIITEFCKNKNSHHLYTQSTIREK